MRILNLNVVFVRFKLVLATWCLSGGINAQSISEDETTVTYPGSFFTQYGSVSAKDMMDRIPGVGSTTGGGSSSSGGFRGAGGGRGRPLARRRAGPGRPAAARPVPAHQPARQRYARPLSLCRCLPAFVAARIVRQCLHRGGRKWTADRGT